jgi:RNA polymerase-binding transcription factor DksA
MKTRMLAPRARFEEEFRDRLLEARLRLARMVATTDDELETLAARESREIAEDPATGTVGDLLSRLEHRERRELEEIDAAQARLEAGAFGVCEGCRKAIPLKRLRALPTARRCATCQGQLETQS